MLQAYWREGMLHPAVFSLFVRRLPPNRNYLLACGLETVVSFLENLRFNTDQLDYLASLEQFSDGFLAWLEWLRFTGDVYAVPEGTPVFANEPLLEVVAPLGEAQLIESFVMNQVHLQTVLASKAARVVQAAGNRSVVDFGLRRMHGADAGLKAARAFYIAGVEATSNVLAGRVFDIPIAGTMAHSYVQAHDREADAFREFTALYPGSVVLVDTYDTIEAIREVIQLVTEGGCEIGGVRLDSGDIAALAVEVRGMLDQAGLSDVEIFASGSLDEYAISSLLRQGATIDGFGVGTSMGVSGDAPSLDMAYKMCAYAGRGRTKCSPGKEILPGRKQVYRFEQAGRSVRDVITRNSDDLPARPLLTCVMHQGSRVGEELPELRQIRNRARRELAGLPDSIQAIEPANHPYAVTLSPTLTQYQKRIARFSTPGHTLHTS
jgi:nicotinate phosphoribosyltransferase